ncbi:biotin transporter BioY [Aquicoccus sp. G2-2]|uniref:biotin transporter BioY n=1 Tax=Aquicoccus sp. G2-2 TaxID=3092120 RepID=UPI002ADF65E2|nr:biotin transporter BioY [Aquicoccus sp. G2-2]MEA1113475.1 biotin transporter BioY [Aquicoccus sp. G2-2]
MIIDNNGAVLIERSGLRGGAGALAKDMALVVLGIGALVLSANIRIPMWPVPVTMQTFAVLLIGAAYGARLSLMTMLGYLALGACGVAVFAGDQAGLAYMAGPTGGYLVGFAVAAALMGALARRGWDRTVGGMAGAMLLGNAVIYTLGLGWMAVLFAGSKGFGWVVQMGMVNFLPGDLLKLALAAMLMPLLWRATNR